MKILLRSAFSVFFSLLFYGAIAQTNQTVTSGATTSPSIFLSGCVYKWTNDKPSIGLAASGMGDILPFTAINNTSSTITATIVATPVADDYAYIPNNSSNNVSLINLSTNMVEKTVAVGRGPTGVAVSPDGSEVYIANTDGNNISVINTASNTTVAAIAVGLMPGGIAFSPDGTRAYVSNFNGNNVSNGSTVSVINTATRSVIASISIGDSPSNVVVSPDGSLLYVATGQASSVIKVYDTSTNQFVRQYLANGASPQAMLFSPDGKKLYVVNSSSNNLCVLDLTGNPAYTILLGRMPYGAVVSPDGRRLYVTNVDDNNVMIIDLATNTVVGTIPVDPSSFGIDITPDGSRLFIPSVNSNKVSVFNTGTNAFITSMAVGGRPYALGNFIKPGTNTICSPVTFTITVNPTIVTPVLTIRAENHQRTYGQTNPAFTVNYDGFIGGDDLSALATLPVVTSAATTLSGAGTYRIDVSGASAPGYVINYEPGVLTVSKARLTITADNQQKIAGERNPPLTMSYGGFVNNDTPGALSQLPQATTTATAQSAPGQYPINISGADADNYDISYIPGLLTVTPPADAIVVPNSFSPNGDGVNDLWSLNFLQNYPQCLVQVFSRSGAKVFSSIGYSRPWDGTYGGAYLPVGTYFFMIDLKNGKRLLSGSITILR